jgi:predicted aldo/keto reductase-like oxidoreductase
VSNKKEGLTRREFLSQSVASLAGLGAAIAPAVLGSEPATAASSPSGQSFAAPAAGDLILRPLGKTGITLPVVSMGVMNAFQPELVKRAFEVGIRYFDTAAYYQRGQNEAMIGQALKEMNARDQTVIGTKIYIPFEQRPTLSPEETRKRFLETAGGSLRRLQTDHIDILCVHNVVEPEYLANAGIREALVKLREEKKVRFFGFSTHTNMAACIEKAVGLGFYDVIVTAFNYALADDQPLLETLRRAKAKGIGVVAMKTQCTQVDYREGFPAEKLALFCGKVMQTAVLKWVLRHDFIATAIPGFTTYDQLGEDFTVARSLEFTPEEKKFIEDRGVKLAFESACVQCRSCIQSCPRGVDVPTLMRTHTYATRYRNFAEARDALLAVPRGKGLDACAECERCAAGCTRRVRVGARISDLLSIYG